LWTSSESDDNKNELLKEPLSIPSQSEESSKAALKRAKKKAAAIQKTENGNDADGTALTEPAPAANGANGAEEGSEDSGDEAEEGGTEAPAKKKKKKKCASQFLVVLLSHQRIYSFFLSLSIFPPFPMDQTYPSTPDMHPLAAKKKKPAQQQQHGSMPAGPAPTEQTVPPTVPVKQLFPGGKFPEGEWQSYKDE
jgi:hypothetical protein